MEFWLGLLRLKSYLISLLRIGLYLAFRKFQLILVDNYIWGKCWIGFNGFDYVFEMISKWLYLEFLATLPRPTRNAALPTPLGNVLPDFVRNAFRIELFTVAYNSRQRPTQRNYHRPGQTFRNALYQAAYPKGQNLQHRACPAALTGASTITILTQRKMLLHPNKC